MQFRGRGAEKRLSGPGQGWARGARHICSPEFASHSSAPRIFPPLPSPGGRVRVIHPRQEAGLYLSLT